MYSFHALHECKQTKKRTKGAAYRVTNVVVIVSELANHR